MKNKGFTLIELLVTMGIIAVLTGMAVFNFNQARSRARDVQRKSDVGQIAKMLELYRNDNNGLYPVLAGNQLSFDYATQKAYFVDTGYTKTIFNDPKGTEWSYYKYYSPDNGKNYYLMSCLENTSDSTRSTTNCGYFYLGGGTGTECNCGNESSVVHPGAMYIITNP